MAGSNQILLVLVRLEYIETVQRSREKSFHRISVRLRVMIIRFSPSFFALIVPYPSLVRQPPPSSPVYFPYIEGSLYKEGNGIISSVWSYRHFELDIHEQTLRWYKVSSSSPSKRILRGEISICCASAELLTNSTKKQKSSKHLLGEVFVVRTFSKRFSCGCTHQNPPDSGSATPSSRITKRGSPQEIYLSAPSLKDANHWISHFNISSKIHHIDLHEKKKTTRRKTDIISSSSSISTSLETNLTASSPSTSLITAPSVLPQLTPIIYLLLPLLVLLLPTQMQVYAALAILYATHFWYMQKIERDSGEGRRDHKSD
jgi:hypothetical protein